MSSEELKPCPFCGDDRLFMSVNEAKMYSIFCAGCASEGPSAVEKQDAASAWNRRAQLAAIQGGMGEAAEVVGWLGGNGLHAEDKMASGAPFPLMTVAQHQRITAAMAADVERLKLRLYDFEHGDLDYALKERDALRAELEAIKGQQPVATIKQREPYEDGTPNPGKALRWAGNNAEDDFPAGTKLYALPPASPDVEALAKALEDCAGRLRLLIDSRRHKMLDVVAEEKARTALSTWRQAPPPSTLPASSAEE